MGGTVSHEFMVPTGAGEDSVAICDCGYAANLEKAESVAPPIEDPANDAASEVFATPGQKTIDDLVKFAGEPAHRFIKTLDYVVESEPVVLLLRGDHQLSEPKLMTLFETTQFRPATPEEAQKLHGASIGSLGPIGLKHVRVLADSALQGRKNMTTGANRDDHHVRNVTPGRDFTPEYHDLRVASAGDGCVRCGKPLRVSICVELGHVFKLGRRYSTSMHASVLDAEGKEIPLVMGSYGIGLERILSSAAEQNHDKDGMFLPPTIAPFDVILTAANMVEESVRTAAETLYAEMQAKGIDVLFDDRPERPGVKFKDADLIGVPIRVTVGKRKVEQGLAEIFRRSTKQIEDVKLTEVVSTLVKGRAN
jgi:prolyl-tRNA synthetase